MAIYICDECGQHYDDDYLPCVEHPTDPTAFCCEACTEAIAEDTPSEKDCQAWDMKESDYL